MPPSLCLWNPAYPLRTSEQLTMAVAAAERFAADLSVKLTVEPQVSQLGGVGFWPPADQRIAAFHTALKHDLILATRGGYGCVDLLAAIPRGQALPYLIGYSDVTVLHAAWQVRGAPESLYGFMPGVPHKDRAILSAICMVQGHATTWQADDVSNVTTIRAGVTTGRLFAGCLRVLAGLIGTPWMPSLHGYILALEDIDERPYSVDRAMWQLHASGALDGIGGLVTNDFPATNPPDYAGPNIQNIIRKWGDRLSVPTLFGFPFGHHANPIALPCGRPTTLTVHDDGRWFLSIDAAYS